MRFPDALRPGDRVAVVAPSSPFSRANFLGGLAWVAQRYRVSIDVGAFSHAGYLAGSDERRVTELSRAMRDPDVRAILIARGGYGATRIVSRLPWDELARAPKWIVGFSDVTALHAKAIAHGVACVHACNVTGLARALPIARATWMSAMERPHAPRRWAGLRAIREGTARGVLFGGNLTVLCAMATARALEIPEGAIVLLEDITERPYRVDRMLTSLLEGGHLARASALVFGDFTECDAGPDAVTVDDVLAERTRALGIPVYANAPFGHGARNEAFTNGADAELGDGALTWR